MSHRTGKILLLIAGFSTALAAAARQQQAHTAAAKAPDKKSAAASNKLLLPYVYLGTSQYRGGPIAKSTFNDLLKQGLTARDTLGARYKILGFEFSYGEKSLYEDSLGNDIVLTDYLTEYCPGDTLSANVSASIYTRAKAGDSVYFDRIRVLRYKGNSTETVPEADATLGIGMKFVITR